MKTNRTISAFAKLTFVLLSSGRIVAIVLFFMLPRLAIAQEDIEHSFDEVPLFVTVQDAGSFESNALIKEKELYLSLTEVFNFLQIRNELSDNGDTLSGMYIDNAPYTVSFPAQTILHNQAIFTLDKEALIKTGGQLYLRQEYWGKVFQLDCNFSFRSLSANIRSKLELPVVREKRQAQIRSYLGKSKHEVPADTSISQAYPLFSAGVADWSVINTESAGINQTFANLNLGAIVAGGETNISLNFSSDHPFRERDQYYQWRRINNNSKTLKQIRIGKVYHNAISSIFDPVIGIQLTNSATDNRHSFGSYMLQNTTRAGETVELYVNNELVDYSKTDASGLYAFRVPLSYGSSEVKLKFYDAYGQERTQTEHVSIPFSFTPAGSFEYMVTGGMVEDIKSSRYGRGSFSYGVSNRFTIGGGAEYLSSIHQHPFIPYATASLRLASSLTLSGEYDHDVKTSAILSYRTRQEVQVDASYTRYHQGQEAISLNFLEQRKLVVSAPVRHANISLFTRLTVDQIVLPTTKYTTAEWMVTGSILGLITHLTTYGVLSRSDPYVYSDLSFSFRLPKGFLFTPECQYEYYHKQLMSVRGRIEKNFRKKGNLGLYYERNFNAGFENIGLDLRFDLSFAQVGLTARRLNGQLNLFQSASGSIRYAPKAKFFGMNSRKSIGRGNIILIPFLDYNNNGIKEKDEPRVAGLKLLSQAGQVKINTKDTSIRISDLQPYSDYLLQLDGTGFTEISWQLKNKTINVEVEPNQYQLIQVPILVIGEVSGTVYVKNDKTVSGQRGIVIDFYRDDNTLAGSTITEEDGYFNFFGLYPGNYIVRVKAEQLQKLKLKATPAVKQIKMEKKPEGSVIGNVEFWLEKR
jgi:hypothetical protein